MNLAAEHRDTARRGRPRVYVDLERAERLRASGHSCRQIARLLGLGYGTVWRAMRNTRQREIVAPERSNNDPKIAVEAGMD